MVPAAWDNLLVQGEVLALDVCVVYIHGLNTDAVPKGVEATSIQLSPG